MPQSTKDAKEEVPLWESPRQLLFGWQIFDEQLIFEGISIEVFDRDLLIAWDLHVVDLILLETQLGLTEDVSHESNFGPLHRRQENIDYSMSHDYEYHLPC